METSGLDKQAKHFIRESENFLFLLSTFIKLSILVFAPCLSKNPESERPIGKWFLKILWDMENIHLQELSFLTMFSTLPKRNYEIMPATADPFKMDLCKNLILGSTVDHIDG